MYLIMFYFYLSDWTKIILNASKMTIQELKYDFKMKNYRQ